MVSMDLSTLYGNTLYFYLFMVSMGIVAGLFWHFIFTWMKW